MKILISGGGIGGLALAYWLRKYGHEPVVVEKAAGLRESGFLISLRSTGVKVVERMGLRVALGDYAIPFRESTWIDKNQRVIKRLKQNDPLKLFVNRGDLHRVLFGAVKDDVEVRWGSGIRDLQQTPDRVDVTFEDETSESFDLAVGADGFHSNTRRLVFGEGFKKFLGAAYFAFSIENRIQSHAEALRTSFNQRIPGYCVGCGACSASGDKIGAYFIYKTDRFTAIPGPERKQFLLETFKHFSPFHRRMLESIEETDYIYHDELTQIEMASWHKGRVALIGDAAHCMTLFSGMGASMALAGAYILARRLSDSQDHRAAFAAYEDRLKGYVSKLQRMGANISRLYLDSNFLTHRLMNNVIRLMPTKLSFRGLAKDTTSVVDLE